jgi:hypothetical protein
MMRELPPAEAAPPSAPPTPSRVQPAGDFPGGGFLPDAPIPEGTGNYLGGGALDELLRRG